jgi:hypothetical protein
MSHIALFHSALGLRPGIRSFAEQLRQSGHTVIMPDLYQGEIFEDSGSGELVNCFRSGLIGTDFGFDDIKEVACMDEHVRFLVDDLIYRFEEVIIDLLFPEVHPAPGSKRLKAAKSRWVSAMWMSFI